MTKNAIAVSYHKDIYKSHKKAVILEKIHSSKEDNLRNLAYTFKVLEIQH